MSPAAFADEVKEVSAPLPPDDSGSEVKLKRKLTLWDAVSFLAGMAIGSGIFATPGLVLEQAGSVGEAMVAWVGAGVIGLCTALLYAELGSCIPKASGEAEFHRAAFGPYWGFAFIWTAFLIHFPGSLTVITSISARYFLAAIPVDGLDDYEPLVKAVAILILATFTIANCLGIREGSFVQNLLAFVKVTLVACLVVNAILFVRRDPTTLQENLTRPFADSSLKGLGPSMVFAMWAFAGTANVAYLTEEMQNPARDVSRASILAILIMAGTYLILNISYLCVLPASTMKSSVTVAVDSAGIGLGRGAGTVVGVLVAISLLASVNGSILCGGRYLYGAARDGHVHVGWLAQLSKSKKVPVMAMVLQCSWCLLIMFLSADVGQLLNYFSAGQYFFSCMIALGHWRLHYTRPDMTRPFKTPLRPLPNLVVVCVCSYMIISTVISDPLSTLCSLALVGSSFPVYVFFVRPQNLSKKSLENGENTTPLLV